MLEKGKISAGEFHILAIIFTIGSTILVLPAPITAITKQNGWIASILTTIVALFFIFLYNQLASLYPSMTYVECNEKVFGKWIGKIASLLFLFYVYTMSSSLLREIGDFFTTQILVETPIQMIIIMFLMTSLIGVRLGLEVISRTAIIFFPWIVVLLFVLFLFLFPQSKLENIQPIFGEGMKPIISGSYHNLGNPYLELLIFLMITPFITEKGKMKKSFYKGTIIGGIVLTIMITFSILVLGADMTARQSYPSFMLGKKIRIGNFLQRIEVIVAIIWILTIYFKLTICYYGLTLGLAQVFGLKNYKILLFPLAFLIITYAIFSYPNIVQFIEFFTKIWPLYSFTICFFLPLLLLMVGKMKKKRSSSQATKLPIN